MTIVIRHKNDHKQKYSSYESTVSMEPDHDGLSARATAEAFSFGDEWPHEAAEQLIKALQDLHQEVFLAIEELKAQLPQLAVEAAAERQRREMNRRLYL